MICVKNTHTEIKGMSHYPERFPFKHGQTIQMDLFTLEGHTFLLVVDVTSRFPVVRILNSETTKSVLNALKRSVLQFWITKESAN